VTTIGMDADAILAALTDAGYLVVHIDSLVETVQDHLADATPVSIRERQEP
jgi:hypothetical protein